MIGTAFALFGDSFMLKFLTVASAAFFMTSAAFAAELQIPSNRPVVSIDVPKGWQADETDVGMEVTSDDGSVYLSVDLASPKKTSDVIDDAIKFLGQQGVDINPKTEKSSDEKLNGRDIFYVSWDGKDKDGPASIGLAALVMDEKTVLVLTYWGTKGDEDANAGKINKMLESIKPVE
jgi:hypothetical protein